MKECLVFGAEWDCPYCENGFCQLSHPERDCDDYYAEMGEE